MPESNSSDFEKVVAVVGKPGLYLLRARTSRGYLLEPLEHHKPHSMMFVPATGKLIHLHRTGLYVRGGEQDTIPLREVFARLSIFKGKLPVDAEPAVQLQFLQKLIPQLDTGRVYPGDAKKVLRWYSILRAFGIKFAPEEKPTKSKTTTKNPRKKTHTQQQHKTTTQKKKQ